MSQVLNKYDPTVVNIALNGQALTMPLRLITGLVNCDVSYTAAATPESTGGNFFEGKALWGWDGAQFSRVRLGSASNLTQTTQPFSLMMSEPGRWAQTNTPAANTQATTSKAAGGATVRHVCMSVCATFHVTAGAISASVQVNLRDGASGAGTVLQSWIMSFGTGQGNEAPKLQLSNLWIPGSLNTAMTLEFAAAGGASTVETVSLTGISVNL